VKGENVVSGGAQKNLSASLDILAPPWRYILASLVVENSSPLNPFDEVVSFKYQAHQGDSFRFVFVEISRRLTTSKTERRRRRET
jgi:hypothetical protein